MGSDEPNDRVMDLKGQSHGSFIRCSGHEKIPSSLDIAGVTFNQSNGP